MKDQMQGLFEVVACWATGPDHSLQLSPGVYDIGLGYEGEPVHASEVAGIRWSGSPILS